MKKIINWPVIVLTFLLLFAAGLRLYKLGSIPAGFHQDEVVNAYVGKFILKNGMDLYGHQWPVLYFDKWGDYPPVLPMYFNGLGSLVFGDTVFAARILPAILGILTVFLIFFLALKIFQDKVTALLPVLIIATNPWHIAFSRVGAEGITAVFFFVLGLTLFAYKKNIFVFFIFLTYLLYPGFRVIIPFTFLGLLFFDYFENKKISKLLFFSLLISIFSTLVISYTFWGRGRFDQTSIISYVQGQKDYFNKFIYNEKSVTVARIFNNKLFYIFREFLKQFFSYLSPVFLFVEGGKPLWFAFPNSGLFYLSTLFFLSFLFIFPEKKKTTKTTRYWFYLITYLFFVSIVPAALTNENSPNMHRSLLMVIFITLFTGYSFEIIRKMKFKNILFIFLGIIFIGEFIYFCHNYFQHVSFYTSIARSDGNKQAALYLKNEKEKYNRVYMMASGWFPIYYLYFASNYQKELIGQVQRGMRMEKLENIYFINKDCQYSEDFNDFIDRKKQNLIVMSTTCKRPYDKRLKPIGLITNESNLPIYHIFKTAQNTP